MRQAAITVMAIWVPFMLWAMEKPKPVSPAASLVLESANNNENSFTDGEFVSVLRGKVVFVYDDIRIRSDEATWWRQKGAILFRDNIRVTRGKQLLTCDRMNFTKESNSITAHGNFVYYDSTERSRLTGKDADYAVASKIFHLAGDPVLTRYDTAVSETLTIKSITMVYVDSLKRATAVDSVRIRKGKLYSTCRFADYATSTDIAYLRGSPVVEYDIHRLTGDSVTLNFAKEKLRDATVVGNAHGVYADTSAAVRGDTTLTHIWGDSLYMALSDSGKLDCLWSVGKAFSKNYRSRDPHTENTASGKIMLLTFGSDGNAKRLKIWGNARSTYFVEDAGGNGCNVVSGDSIAVSFFEGKAKFVSLAGSTRGIYFPTP